MPSLLSIIISADAAVRNRSLDTACLGLSLDELLRECQQLDEYRRGCDNLYNRVRSLFFLYAIHRFHLPKQLAGRESGRIPYGGYEHMLNRRYPEAIDVFLARLLTDGPSVSLSSALCEAYHRLAFQTLAAAASGAGGELTGNILISKGAGALAAAFAAVNIFGGFLVTQRMLAMYKKKG